MFFLAAAGGAQQGINGIDPTSIVNQIGKFLPLETLAKAVDQAMSGQNWLGMNTIGLCLIIIATVQEIPRTQGGEFFNVILRAIIALAVMAIITPLMWGGEVLVQNLVSVIAGDFVKNTVDFTGFGPVQGGAVTRAQILYDFHVGGLFDKLHAPQALDGNPLDIADDLKRLLEWLIFGCLACLSLFVTFVMTLMLYVQKAILIFGLLLMPPFIGLQTWQGSARFLGVHYIQSMLGVLCWPIGWAFIYLGSAAAMHNLNDLFQKFADNNNGTEDLVLLIGILANFLLTSLWMVIGTVMAPGLINKVITAGGNFAAGAMGAVSGKAVGAAGDAIKGATTAAGAIAGAAAGAAVGGPAGAKAGLQVGSQLGGSVGAVAAAPGDSVRNSITQATGEGGGGAAPSGASFDAGLAALAQTGKGRGGTS
jgi:hypothetical protein